MELSEKKLTEVDPMLVATIKEVSSQVESNDNQQMKNYIRFFVNNINPPDEREQYSFQMIDDDLSMYLGSTKDGAKAQIYLHFDQVKSVMHIMPFTFAEQSVDRLLIFLNNNESLRYSDGELPSERKQQPIVLYYYNERMNDITIAPLVFDNQSKSYHVAEGDDEFLKEMSIRHLPRNCLRKDCFAKNLRAMKIVRDSFDKQVTAKTLIGHNF